MASKAGSVAALNDEAGAATRGGEIARVVCGQWSKGRVSQRPGDASPASADQARRDLRRVGSCAR